METCGVTSVLIDNPRGLKSVWVYDGDNPIDPISPGFKTVARAKAWVEKEYQGAVECKVAARVEDRGEGTKPQAKKLGLKAELQAEKAKVEVIRDALVDILFEQGEMERNYIRRGMASDLLAKLKGLGR